MLKFSLAVSFAASLLLLPNLAHAGGPWPQPRGDAYLKLSGWWLRYDEHYTSSGGTDPNVTTGNYNAFLYAEYGLTDRLTGVVNGAVFARTVQNDIASGTSRELITPGGALNGVGDIDVALKYGLTEPGSNVPVAATLLFGLPTGNSAGGADGRLQLGDGEFNQMLRLDAGRGIRFGESTTGYVSGYGGFNNRTRGFSDEVRLGLEAGAGLLEERLWLIARVDAVESLKNGEPSALTSRTGIFANNTEFVSIGLEANVYLNDRLGLSVGAATAVRGEIIAAGNTFSAGVFLDLE